MQRKRVYEREREKSKVSLGKARDGIKIDRKKEGLRSGIRDTLGESLKRKTNKDICIRERQSEREARGRGLGRRNY